MAADADEWQDGDLVLFASLLHVEASQLRNHHNLVTARAAYFGEITHDLFLDPDTGIATGNVRYPWQYAMPKEIHTLLSAYPTRTVAVYQHIRARRTRDRIQEIIAVLAQSQPNFACASYESATVAMLFLSQSADRIAAINETFRNWLGRHADGRIGVWTKEAAELADAHARDAPIASRIVVGSVRPPA
jgi:hypothetical protein